MNNNNINVSLANLTNNDVLKAVIMFVRLQVELCLSYKLKYIKTPNNTFTHILVMAWSRVLILITC